MLFIFTLRKHNIRSPFKEGQHINRRKSGLIGAAFWLVVGSGVIFL